MNEGWRCPVCGRCYAPIMMQCSFCPQSGTTTGSTVKILMPERKQSDDRTNTSGGTTDD